MRTFVMGDIHGTYKAFNQCIEKSGFDYNNDLLIVLGDITDGYDEVSECVEALLKVKNLVAIRGNHDLSFLEFLQTGHHPFNWSRGGRGTAISYLRSAGKETTMIQTSVGYQTTLVPEDVPLHHRLFFQNQKDYHIDDQERCFVHAGFNRHIPFHGQNEDIYYTDRDLWYEALNWHHGIRHIFNDDEFRIATEFKEIYLGHTSTLHWKIDQPMKAGNIFNLDTGAGDDGKLTILDIDAKKYWQSDSVNYLYLENHRYQDYERAKGFRK